MGFLILPTSFTVCLESHCKFLFRKLVSTDTFCLIFHIQMFWCHFPWPKLTCYSTSTRFARPGGRKTYRIKISLATQLWSSLWKRASFQRNRWVIERNIPTCWLTSELNRFIIYHTLSGKRYWMCIPRTIDNSFKVRSMSQTFEKSWVTKTQIIIIMMTILATSWQPRGGRKIPKQQQFLHKKIDKLFKVH